MNDNELLKLAAKAAGIHRDTLDSEWYDTDGHVRPDWNPLTDDGDALRLAVKLRLFAPELDPYIATAQLDIDDPYAETRRAIVRAAAEVGKTM